MYLLHVAVVVLFLIQAFDGADGGAEVSVKFISYKNPDGRRWNGDRCDRWAVGKYRDCDHMFYICIDEYDGDDSLDDCLYEYKETGEYANEEDIDFDHDMNGVANPITFHVNSWEGFKLKVESWDDDTSVPGGHDLVDKIIRDYYKERARTEDESSAVRKVWTGQRDGPQKTSLTVDIEVWCEEDYYGLECDVYCEAQDSDVHGHYDCDEDTGEKLCLDGWESPDDDCKIYIDNCEFNMCLNEATCLDEFDSYTCICAEGYTGAICQSNIDDCAENACKNGGSCVDDVGGFTCECADGYIGASCDVDLCDVLQCSNGGSCDEGTCECADGFAGTNCEIDIDECSSNPCKNDGTCEDKADGYECHCLSGYTGSRCQKPITTPVPYTTPAYTATEGTTTEVPIYTTPPSDYTTPCWDCDDCSPNKCKNGGICHDGINSYTCECPSGFEGKKCQYHTCNFNGDVCQNGATCVEDEDGLLGGYSCICPVGYTGLECDVDLCDYMDCHNGGACFNGMCDCTGTGYKGSYCATDVNECSENPCENEGICENYPGTYACKCPSGYSGEHCQLQVGEQRTEDSLPMWTIGVGVALGILLILIFLLLAFLLMTRKKRKKRQATATVIEGGRRRRQNSFANPLFPASTQTPRPAVNTANGTPGGGVVFPDRNLNALLGPPMAKGALSRKLSQEYINTKDVQPPPRPPKGGRSRKKSSEYANHRDNPPPRPPKSEKAKNVPAAEAFPVTTAVTLVPSVTKAPSVKSVKTVKSDRTYEEIWDLQSTP